MDQKLETFVSLLDRHRRVTPTPDQPANLPEWARRALSKLPEPSPPGRAPTLRARFESAPKPVTPAAPPKPMPAMAPINTAAPPPPSKKIAPPVIAATAVAPTQVAPPVAEKPAPLAVEKIAPPPVVEAPTPQPIVVAPPIVVEPPLVIAAVEAPPFVVTIEPIAAREIAPEEIAEPESVEAPLRFDPPELRVENETPIEPAPAAMLETPTPVMEAAHADVPPDLLADFAKAAAAKQAQPPRQRGRMSYAIAASLLIVAIGAGALWYLRSHGIEGNANVIARLTRPSPPAPTDTTANKPSPPVAPASNEGKVAMPPAPPPSVAPEKIVTAEAPKPEVTPTPAPAPTPATAPIADATPATPPPSLAPSPTPSPAPVADATPQDKPAPVTPANDNQPKPAPVVTAAKDPAPEAVKPPDAVKPDDTKPVVAALPDETKPVAAAKPEDAKPVVAAKPDEAKPVAEATPPKPEEAKPAIAVPPSGNAPSEPVRTAALPPPRNEPATAQPAAMIIPSPTTQTTGEAQWLKYALPSPAFTGQPRVAIVIDDLGLDKKRTERAIALKGPVTLSFLAYASDLPQQTEAASKAGHELIVHVPMEPIARPQESGKAVPVAVAHDEVLRRLRWDLGRFNGYVGINNHMGSRFSSDPDAMQTIVEELKARGLLFLDARTVGAQGNSMAERIGVPTASRDVFIDEDVNAVAINSRLAALETIARQRGTAIAIAHPHDQTLDVLTVWIANLASKGLQLVPLTAIVKERNQHLAGAG